MNTVKELKKTIKQCRSFMKAARELNGIKKGSLALEVVDVANELKKKAMELHDQLWEEYGELILIDI